MPTQIDHEESDLLRSFEQGQLKSIASKSELVKFKAFARATALKDCRVNIRLADLTGLIDAVAFQRLAQRLAGTGARAHPHSGQRRAARRGRRPARLNGAPESTRAA